MDSRGDARAASAGSILVTRLMVRGVAGVQSGRASNRGRMWTSGVVGEGVGVGVGAAVMRAGWACAASEESAQTMRVRGDGVLGGARRCGGVVVRRVLLEGCLRLEPLPGCCMD